MPKLKAIAIAALVLLTALVVACSGGGLIVAAVEDRELVDPEGEPETPPEPVDPEGEPETPPEPVDPEGEPETPPEPVDPEGEPETPPEPVDPEGEPETPPEPVDPEGEPETPPEPVDPEGEPETPLVEIKIRVEIPYPPEAMVNRGIQGATAVCLSGCESNQRQVSNDQGEVTFTGLAPITVKVEKSGYISVEQRVFNGARVLMGNEWPEETEVAIRQSGLGDVIASSQLLLVWADDKYIPEVAEEIGVANLGGWIDCSILIVRHYSDRSRMLGIAIHEIAHGWIGLRTHGTTCNPTDEAWVATAEGRGWVEAMEKDFNPETGPGPIENFDDEWYGVIGVGPRLVELPRHSLAEFYRHWYGYGRFSDRLCQLAPARCQYLEDHLGSRPIRPM